MKDKSHRGRSTSGQWWRRQWDHSNAWDFRQRSGCLHQKLLSRLFALTPWLRNHAAEAVTWPGDLKYAFTFRKGVIDIVHLLGEKICLVNGSVRRSLDDGEHHSLIFVRRQLPLREHVERHHRHYDNSPQ